MKDHHSPILRLAAIAARWLPGSVKQSIYRVPWLARWVRSRLNLAAPTGLSRVLIAAGRLTGARLELDLQAEKDYWLGTYEPELQQALGDWVRSGQIAYDLGANIGYISLSLARIVGPEGQVYAFEALPDNLRRLRQNVSLNSEGAWIKVIAAAVAERRGSIIFQVGPSGGTGKAAGSAGRDRLPYLREIEVMAITLDDFVYREGNPAPDVIKIDIEGGEILALPGMVKVLEQARPVVLMELHGPEASQLTREICHQYRYRLLQMTAGYPPVAHQQPLKWKAYVIAQPIES